MINGGTGVWDIPLEQFSSVPQLKKEIEDLKHIVHRYYDFWEWYEDKYGSTEREMWDEFEAWEDEQAKNK